MADTRNWVEHRAWLETTLKTQAPELWQRVRAALQDACESFARLYGTARDGIKCEPENSHRLRISLTYKPDDATRAHVRSSILVAFKDDPVGIEVTTDTHSARLPIEVDDQGVFLSEHLTPDQASERILRPLLFPKS